jgi:hypothetical protein
VCSVREWERKSGCGTNFDESELEFVSEFESK